MHSLERIVGIRRAIAMTFVRPSACREKIGNNTITKDPTTPQVANITDYQSLKGSVLMF